jgi:hypothetical protein
MQGVNTATWGQTSLISVQRSGCVFLLETGGLFEGLWHALDRAESSLLKHSLLITVILTLKTASCDLKTSIFGAFFLIAGPTLIGNLGFFE